MTEILRHSEGVSQFSPDFYYKCIIEDIGVSTKSLVVKYA